MSVIKQALETIVSGVAMFCFRDNVLNTALKVSLFRSTIPLL